MNYIDLFAGAGGLSEGFTRAGFEPIAHVEIDPDACNTLRTRTVYHDLRRRGLQWVYDSYLRGDVTRDRLYSYLSPELLDSVINESISSETLPRIFELIRKQLDLRSNPPVDLIIGGPPCQPFSVAGRARLGREAMERDERSQLYVQYAEFLRRYQPRMFVFENVLGLLSFRQRNQLGLIRDCFYEAGYEMDVHYWDARDFGVLQSRKRLVIVGWQREAAKLGYPRFTISRQDGFVVNDVLRDLPPLLPNQSYRGRYLTDPTPYLERNGLRDKNSILTWHETRPHRSLDLGIYAKAIKIWNEEGRRLRYPDDLEDHEIQHRYKSGFFDRFKVVGKHEAYSQTVVAHIHKDGHYYIHPEISQCRSLSVREAARLQSFPDNYFFEGPRTAAFKQIGNAVPPLMADRIAGSIRQVLKGQGQFLPPNTALTPPVVTPPRQLVLDYNF